MRCTRHLRDFCYEYDCTVERGRDNAGQVSIGANTGDVNLGIGGGLTVDLEDGELGIQIAPGISIDL